MNDRIKLQKAPLASHFPSSQSSFQDQEQKRDGDLQSQARIRLSKDELRTDILSGDGR